MDKNFVGGCSMPPTSLPSPVQKLGCCEPGPQAPCDAPTHLSRFKRQDPHQWEEREVRHTEAGGGGKGLRGDQHPGRGDEAAQMQGTR